MSGIGKALGKVFKAIGKVVKKILPIVLMVAAVVFTAGAAIPAVGALVGTAGWGAAAGGITSALGISSGSVLGGVVTGAITQAGFGAIAGAGIAAITGGKWAKGAAAGALTGAITGGVTGGIGAATAPIPDSVTVTPAQQLGGAGPATAGPAGVAPASGALSGAPPAAAAPAAGAPGAGAAATTGATQPTTALGRIWGEVKNSEFAGSMIRGLGEGLTSMSEQNALKEQQERIAGNYGTGGEGLLSTDMSGRAGVNPTGMPANRSAIPENPLNATGSYVWDPVAQDIVFKSNASTGAKQSWQL